MYQAAVLLDFHGSTTDAELQLPLERLQIAMNTKLSRQNIEQERGPLISYLLRNFSASVPGGPAFRIDPVESPQLESIEGAPYVVARFRLTPPPGAPSDLLDLHCGVLLDRIPSQVVLVSVRTDWRTATFADEPRLLGVLRGGDQSVRIDRRDGNWWHGFGGVFHLGMRHIAEGTDHLLFLLVLLFPAPLLIRRAKWVGYSDMRPCLWRIGKIVTAFTAGHSITLAASAIGVVHVPSRPIEVLIAFSILVSAIHALRPVFPGREAVVAGCFGLVHGLAFATTLAGLGLGRWDRVASIFGFNLGIEAMQLVVVAIALPSLILLSRTLLYSSLRIAGAILAGAIALLWIAQRLWDLPNPADAFVMALAQRAGWIAAGLTALGAMALRSPKLRANALPRRANENPAPVFETSIHTIKENCLETQ
jgi:hypothetical protein